MIELVSIGDEVLYGYTINQNASFMAKQLLETGFLVSRHSVVSDEKESVQALLNDAFLRSRFVIATGGLGPTCDDKTKKSVAELFNLPIVTDESLRKMLQEKFDLDTATLDNQCMLPKGAHLFENNLGTAPGFALVKEKSHLICLPGVPAEMKAMFFQVIAYIKKHCSIEKKLCTEVLHFHSVKEVQVDAVLRSLRAKYPHVQVGIYPGFSVQTVHLTCQEKRDSEDAKKYLLEHFGAYQFHAPTLVQAVHSRLLDRGITLATAESCTGGGLAKAFVEHPGASQYFQGSVVTYSNESKVKILHVPEKVLNEEGAVSCEVTEVMAQSVQALFSTTCSIAVSGILGPTGETPTKPVGTVCATIYFQDKEPDSWTMHFHGSREAILEQVIQAIAAKLYKNLSFS